MTSGPAVHGWAGDLMFFARPSHRQVSSRGAATSDPISARSSRRRWRGSRANLLRRRLRLERCRRGASCTGRFLGRRCRAAVVVKNGSLSTIFEWGARVAGAYGFGRTGVAVATTMQAGERLLPGFPKVLRVTGSVMLRGRHRAAAAGPKRCSPCIRRSVRVALVRDVRHLWPSAIQACGGMAVRPVRRLSGLERFFIEFFGRRTSLGGLTYAIDLDRSWCGVI